ncbi:hypothetical protein [Cloacibacillus evryensis]|uniref:hypothetical protein n=1 Tax=Cloacibacillus evryensis TaxID=508460 RepID=UPI00210CBBD2|nr:hypothetical protein [Cloacibacillus evryensis]MCQ4762878.1 hypothetical protein [Cloacibacillus evryensis]
MNKYLRPAFLIPISYSLFSAALTILLLAAAASRYTAHGGAAVFFFRYGYLILAAFGAAAAVSPLGLPLCLWLSLRHRGKSAGESPLYRTSPLVMSAVTQGILLAALLFFIISNLF